MPLPRSPLLLALTLAACAGPERPPPATAAHFDAIQRQEAILDEVRVTVLEGEDCEDVRAGRDRGCEASERICAIAESVTDADAEARCTMAEARCTRYRAAAERCE